MKRTTSFIMSLVAMLLVVGTTSCTKDGVYNPKKKVSRIYVEDAFNGVTTGKTLVQSWTWSDDKLTKIDYNDAGYSSILTYDGNQISAITSGDYKANFVYDGSKLKSVEFYDGTTLESRIDVKERSGSKITKLYSEEYDYDVVTNTKKADQLVDFKTSAMQFIVPTAANKTLKDNVAIAMKKRAAAKGTLTCNITIAYDKNNVSKEDWVYSDGDTYTHDFTYDDKNNPLYNFFMEEGAYADVYSKNNILTQKMTEVWQGTTDAVTYNFRYDYDGDWPVKSVRSNTEAGDVTRVYTTFYEY